MALSLRLNTAKDPKEIINKLLSMSSIEFNEIKALRNRVSKKVWPQDYRYAVFLRHLYANAMDPGKVLHAMNNLRESRDETCIPYIKPNHLEMLISKSMEHPKLFTEVYQGMEQEKVHITARERAQYVYHQFLLKKNWLNALSSVWETLCQTKDTGALNILLKVGYSAGNTRIVNLILNMLKNRSDRFTELVKLRHDRDTPPVAVFRQFSEQKYIIDCVALTSYICGLTRHGSISDVRSIESIFDEIIKKSRGYRVQIANQNQAGTYIKALDTISKSLDAKVTVQLVADKVFYEKMLIYYDKSEQYSKAVNILVTMTEHEYILPRHIVRDLINKISTLNNSEDLLKRLFYICCDANYEHPGFVSESLAEHWSQVLEKYMSIEDAQKLVYKNKNTYH